MAPPTESDGILAAEQKKEEKNKAREERKKAEAEKKQKEADDEAMKLRNAQLELANSIRFKKGRPGNNGQPAVSRAKSDKTQSSMRKPDEVAILGMRLDYAILRMGVIEKIAPVINNVDQSSAVASISSSTGSEILVGQIPIRLPFSSEETKTSDQEMNKNVELALEKDNNVNNNAEAETVPGTNMVTTTLPVEEIDDLNAVPETNQYANAIDLKEIPLVSGAETTLDHGKTNDDDSFEATGNEEANRTEEQNESTGEANFLAAPTTSVPVQEEKYKMNDVPGSPHTNQFANATDMEEIPLVPKTTMNFVSLRWSDESDDDDFEARGNEVMTEEEQNESSGGKGIVLGSTTTTMTTSAPVQEGNNINDAPETSQYEPTWTRQRPVINNLSKMRESLGVPKAKTNMDQAKNGNDDKFEVKRRKVRKEKSNAHNSVADQKDEKNRAIKADAGEEKNKAEEEARNARLEHNRRLLAQANFAATNVEAIVLGTSPEAESITSQHSEGDSTEDVPETNRSTDLLNMKGPEAKSSNGDEKHKAKAGGEKLPKAMDKKAANAEGTDKTNKGKKAETRRKECCNKFSLLLEESETEVTKIEVKSVPEKEQDAEAANGFEEVAIAKKRRHKKKRKAEVTANITEEKPQSDEYDAQSSCEKKVEETISAPAATKEEEAILDLCESEEERDQEAKRVEEAAAAEMKREKNRERKKKKKAKKPGKSCLSVGLLPYLALAGLLAYNFLQVMI